MVDVLYVSDGLIFADSTGLVLFLRSKGNLAKMRALMPSPMAKMPYVRAKTIVLENVVCEVEGLSRSP